LNERSKKLADIANKNQRFTLEGWMRRFFKSFLDSFGGYLNRLGFKPNTITIIGLAGNFVSAILMAFGLITWGGITMLLSGIIDTLDGSMARLRGSPTEFGGFVDSVSDRYSEAFVFAGLLIYYLRQEDWLTSLAIYLAITGSLIVSYVKARAERAGYDAKVGVLTRLERVLVLSPSLIFGIPKIGIWIIAILGNFTALQRIIHVRRQAYAKMVDRQDKDSLP
jgi:CDP-diacylglycerol--glycerol-3-phosphate 3-phosphatidyltransferase